MKTKKIIYVLIFLFTVLPNFFYAKELEKNNKNNSENEQKITDLEEKIPELPEKGSISIAMASSDYPVTAGDVYHLSYSAGSSTISTTIPVDSSYKIRVSNLAVIDVKGKTYTQLKKEVEDIVQKNYPMGGVQFILQTPASFKVTVRGEVKKTYEKEVWALTRLSSVIVMNEYSSIRDVKVTSVDGKTNIYDIYKAERFGDLSQNPYLRPNDIITVEHIDRVVSIEGAVERPGEYQLLKGENLKDLIEIYGNGCTRLADLNNIELIRTSENIEKAGFMKYLSQTDYNNNYELKNYDSIYIPTYEISKPVMFIEGAIGDEFSEGAVLESSNKVMIRFETGTNISTLIREYSSRFPSIADLEHSYIIRGNQIIPVNIREILYNSDYTSNISVQSDDILRIPFKQFFVTVSGSVVNPGRYPYIPDRTYDYYIALAGGFLKLQNSGEAVKIIEIDGNELSKTDVITPESRIIAKTNSGTFYFNQYSGVLTTVLSIVSTTVSILVATGLIVKK